MIKRWMSVSETAEYLGVAAITIYRWLKKEQIPAHRIGKQWRFDQNVVDAWVKSSASLEDAEELAEEIITTELIK